MKIIKTKPVFARLPKKEIADMEKICKQRDITISQVIRRLLRIWVNTPEIIEESYLKKGVDSVNRMP